MQQTFAAHGLLLVHFTIKSAVALGRTFVSIFFLVRFLLVLQIRELIYTLHYGYLSA